jgi:SAM-dependent methyltransferase
MGYSVFGSDLSEAMLAQTRERLAKQQLQIPVATADFRTLEEVFDCQFDAVVCLTNSINEPLEEAGASQALSSMRAVLRDGGVLIFDQGQTDAMMKDPPRFVPAANSRDFSRLMAMEYAGAVMTVHILDFEHTEYRCEFEYSAVRMRVRLHDEWATLLDGAGFKNVEFYGDWAATPYDKNRSARLIAVAQK